LNVLLRLLSNFIATNANFLNSWSHGLKGELMKKLLLILTLSSLAFSLVACNTVQGVGRDIEKSATWTKEKLP
jgi:predicted small secreted protein